MYFEDLGKPNKYAMQRLRKQKAEEEKGERRKKSNKSTSQTTMAYALCDVHRKTGSDLIDNICRYIIRREEKRSRNLQSRCAKKFLSKSFS